MKIKALSLWEPWASLMRLGAKTIETRSWATSYRGPLLICAAKRRNLEDLSDLFGGPCPNAFRDALGLGGRWDCTVRSVLDRLHFGQAVAIVDLYDCAPTHARSVRRELSDQAGGMLPESYFGNFAPGRWAWMTRTLRVIEPFPVRGRQGLFEVELPPGVAS